MSNKKFDNEISTATLKIMKRINNQPELKIYFNQMENAEKSYMTGDVYNIIVECIGKCLEEERKHILKSEHERIWYETSKGDYRNG